MARKGHKRKIGFEGGQMRLIRRLPKVGFKSAVHLDFAVVNVGVLEGLKDVSEVTPAVLRERQLVNGPQGITVKILGDGKLSRKLTVKAHAFSAGARNQIESAGGTCEILKD